MRPCGGAGEGEDRDFGRAGEADRHVRDPYPAADVEMPALVLVQAVGHAARQAGEGADRAVERDAHLATMGVAGDGEGDPRRDVGEDVRDMTEEQKRVLAIHPLQRASEIVVAGEHVVDPGDPQGPARKLEPGCGVGQHGDAGRLQGAGDLPAAIMPVVIAQDGEGGDGGRKLGQGRDHGLDPQLAHEGVAGGDEVAGQEHELGTLGQKPPANAGHAGARHLRQGGMDVGQDADAQRGSSPGRQGDDVAPQQEHLRLDHGGIGGDSRARGEAGKEQVDQSRGCSAEGARPRARASRTQRRSGPSSPIARSKS